ncbi:MAG: T9SS type A sorting domain-containing protein [Chitinophagales bacterium]
MKNLIFILLLFCMKQATASCDSLKLVSIQINQTADTFIVIIQNDNRDHINYPIVQMTGKQGDTIVNRARYFNIFAHLGAGHQEEYRLAADWFPASFDSICEVLITDGIYDSIRCVLRNYCAAGVPSISKTIFRFSNKVLQIENAANEKVSVYNLQGELLLEQMLTSGSNSISLKDLPRGYLFVRVGALHTRVLLE